MKKFILFALFINFASAHSQCIVGNCQEGYGERKIDGDKYEGFFLNGKRSGNGTYTWASGNKYIGEWKESQYHGYGALQTSSGAYEGDFKFGKKHGLGTQYDSNGGIIFAGQYNENSKVLTSSTLTTDVLGDLYLLEAKRFMEAKSYRTAIVSYNKILALKVSPPINLYYFLGKCYSKALNYNRAISALNKYLTLAGRNSEYYAISLELLSDAESKVNSTNQDFVEKKMEIKNCSICHGSGYYNKNVNCTGCRGTGKVWEYCSQCGGNGQSSTQCTYCWGKGVVFYNNSDGTLNSYGCQYCRGGWVSCSKCGGRTGYDVTCNNCNGYRTVKEQTKCYRH